MQITWVVLKGNSDVSYNSDFKSNKTTPAPPALRKVGEGSYLWIARSANSIGPY